MKEPSCKNCEVNKASGCAIFLIAETLWNDKNKHITTLRTDEVVCPFWTEIRLKKRKKVK